jgi:hypothetical protein
MTSADLLPAAVLKHKAVVYIRQSTQAQVQTNLESQRRQYELVDVARERGFRDVEVIDDDLGRSASGTMAPPALVQIAVTSKNASVRAVGPSSPKHGVPDLRRRLALNAQTSQSELSLPDAVQ